MTIGVTKNLTDSDNPSHSLGEQPEYTVTATVPFDISTRDHFDVTDIPDAGLDDLADTIAVKADGEDLDATAFTKADVKDPDDYTAFSVAKATAGTGFKLQFDPAKLEAYAGKTLTITYKAQVTKDTVATLQNHVGVDFGHNPHITTSKTPVEVGGQKFIKTDADTGKTLADAVFVLEDSNGKIITKTQGDDGKDVYQAIDATGLDVQKLNAAVEDKTGTDKVTAAQDELATQIGAAAKNAVVAISDEKGAFEFIGLAYKDYQAVEIAAPQKHVVATKATTFTVNKTSYDDTKAIKITNAPKGVLPSTGGMGIYIVIAAGLALVALGFVFLRRGKHHEEV